MTPAEEGTLNASWKPARGDRSMPRARRAWRSSSDVAFKGLTIGCAALIAALMLAITGVLLKDAWPSIKAFGAKFLVSTAWNPGKSDFGGLTSIYGTLSTTVIAMIIAVPLALLIALLLVELVHPRVGKIIGTAIELLAAIPSIIYGMWGIFVLVPLMQQYVQPAIQHTWLGRLPLFTGPPLGVGILTAGLILALMVLPFITAVSRDVLRMVPQVVKEAGYGMGSTTWEVTRKVSLRYGLSGIVGAVFLGLGRAVGETMAVAYVIGSSHIWDKSLFAPGNTIASTLANEFAEASNPLYRSAMVELGLIFFAMTIIFQLVAHVWLRRVRRQVGGR